MKSPTQRIALLATIAAVLVGGYLIIDEVLFDGVRPQHIQNEAFQGSFFVKEGIEKQPSVVLLGGGVWGDYWAQEFAKAGYSGLSLPYVGQEGLPELPERIPLEYFEHALMWLQDQTAVDAAHIVVMGASRNAELALVLGAYLPEDVSGVIAYAPSAVSWSNTVLPYTSDAIQPSWTLRGQAIPYLAMEKIQPPAGGVTINPLPYWTAGLSDSSDVAAAMIPVEKCNGPILLLSGKSDGVWPSAQMSDMLAARCEREGFAHSVRNIQYGNSGHMISSQPNSPSTLRTGAMRIGETTYSFDFGGTEAGDDAAKRDAAKQVFALLDRLGE